MPIQYPATIELSDLDGKNGFQMNGSAAGDRSGFSVSSSGDINDDNIGDIIIGAYLANANGAGSGQSYIVFGRASLGLSGTFELSTLNGNNGLKLNGITAGDYSAISASHLGDINDDGINDLIIGAYLANPNGVESGQSYVIFGSATIGQLDMAELMTGCREFKVEVASLREENVALKARLEQVEQKQNSPLANTVTQGL